MGNWYLRVVAGVVVTGAIAAAIIVLLPNKPQVPQAIKKQLIFTLLLPSGQFKLEHGSAKYNSQLKLLTYTVPVAGHTVVVSEQPTPQSFTDVPAVYQQLLNTMSYQTDFDTNVGTIYITTPKQLNGKQAAVLNTKGTLLFAKPVANLSSDQWRQLFTSFQVVQ